MIPHPTTPSTNNAATNSHHSPKGVGGPTVAEVDADAEVEGLRTRTNFHNQANQENSSAISTKTIWTLPPANAQKRGKLSKEWRLRKKSKLIRHTSWSGQPCYLTFPPTPAFNSTHTPPIGRPQLQTTFTSSKPHSHARRIGPTSAKANSKTRRPKLSNRTTLGTPHLRDDNAYPQRLIS